MQIYHDALEAVRSVGSEQPECASLPACYPTIVPYTSNYVGYNGEKATNITAFNLNANDYDCTNVIDPSLCTNSKLIQRLRHKIDLYQTPSSNDARQILQRLANIVKKHVPSFVFNETLADDAREQIGRISQLQSNIQQGMLSTPKSITSTSRSSSPSQRVVDRKIIDERLLSKPASHDSRLSDNSLYSRNLPTYDLETSGRSTQFLPTQGLQSLSTENEISFEKKDKRNRKVFDSHPSDHNNRASIVMSIPVPSMSSTAHSSDQQVAHNQLRQAVSNMVTTNSHQDNSTMTLSTPNISDHQLGSDRINSAIDLKSNSFLSPSSHNQQSVNKKSSPKRITSSIVQSPTSSIIDYERHELLTPSSSTSPSVYLHRSPSIQSHFNNQIQHTLPTFDENTDRNGRQNDYQHLSHKIMRDDKIEKRNNWIQKLTSKVSSKRLNTKSFSDLSPQNISHMYINDQHRTDLDHIDMREAMNAFELDLTQEAFQALMNKKKDCRQNGLMRILSSPARCCRSCRTQRRLATAAQRSIDIAIQNIQIPLINN